MIYNVKQTAVVKDTGRHRTNRLKERHDRAREVCDEF